MATVGRAVVGEGGSEVGDGGRSLGTDVLVVTTMEGAAVGTGLDVMVGSAVDVGAVVTVLWMLMLIGTEDGVTGALVQATKSKSADSKGADCLTCIRAILSRESSSTKPFEVQVTLLRKTALHDSFVFNF